jgi:hypothetical protein
MQTDTLSGIYISSVLGQHHAYIRKSKVATVGLSEKVLSRLSIENFIFGVVICLDSVGASNGANLLV